MENIKNKLNYFSEIESKKPSDLIMSQIIELINNGTLKLGDSLPSERVMVDLFGVGRSHVREAISKLVLFGILETRPQSGTRVIGYKDYRFAHMFLGVPNIGDESDESVLEFWIHLENSKLSFMGKDEQIEQVEQIIHKCRNNLKNSRFTFFDDLEMHLLIKDLYDNNIVKKALAIFNPIVFRICANRIELDKNMYDDLNLYIEYLGAALDNRDPDHFREILRKHNQQIIKWVIATVRPEY